MQSPVNNNKLKLISYNMHGYNQGITTVADLIASLHPGVFLLQEHWLTPANLDAFDKKFSNYFTFGCSAMTRSVESGLLRGRPFGGVMFTIVKNLRKLTEVIYCCDRFALVKVANYVVVNVYLPCSGTNDRSTILDDVLAELQAWLERYCHVGYYNL